MNCSLPTPTWASTEKDLNYIASMGIYIFKKDVLIDLLEHNVKEDFGREVIPDSIADHQVFAYVFTDYWEDIGTIKAFFEANLDFANPIPHFDFYNEDGSDLHPQALFARFQDRKLRHPLFADLRRLDHRGQQTDQHRHRHPLDHPRQFLPGTGGHDGGRLL